MIVSDMILNLISLECNGTAYLKDKDSVPQPMKIPLQSSNTPSSLSPHQHPHCLPADYSQLCNDRLTNTAFLFYNAIIQLPTSAMTLKLDADGICTEKCELRSCCSLQIVLTMAASPLAVLARDVLKTFDARLTLLNEIE
jgi:hypothetical protein